MKKKDSLITKVFAALLILLTIIFVIIDVVSVRIVKEEVLNQIKTDNQKLVDSYVELMKARNCTDTSDYQAFVDYISSINTLNYALYIEDINGNVTAVAHSNPDRVGLILEDAGSIAAARNGEPYVGYYTDPVSGGLTLDVLTPVHDDAGSLKGALNLGIPVDETSLNALITKAAGNLSLMAVSFSILLLVLVCGFLYLLIIRPIRHLCVNIEKLSHYDLSDDSSGLVAQIKKRKDEIGLIGKGFEAMRTSLITLVGEIKSATIQLMNQSDELSEVSQRVAEMGDQLSISVSEVANGAASQAQATAEGQEQINQLSRVLETVRADMELLNTSTRNVHLIKEEGIEALKVVVANTEKSQANSEKVQDVIMETSHQTDRIKAASSQIREIASQTNLLALNASIEAARAGDAGRGFAVVASEIGNLAGETNDLTAQIEEIVQDLVTKMELAVHTIDDMHLASAEQSTSVSQTQEKFNHISENIIDMEDKCTHLNESTARMAESRNAIVSMISDLSAISEENAACMEEASASVTEEAKALEQVSSASNQVAALAEALTSHVSSFKTE